MKLPVVRVLAYLLVVAMGAFGLWRVENEIANRAATDCVDAWHSTEAIRDGDEATYRRNAQTLVALSEGANPDQIAAYLAQVERDVAEIRAKNPDPDCDLGAALRRLDR